MSNNHPDAFSEARNIAPWAPKGERHIGNTAVHVVTEDSDGGYRVYRRFASTPVCLSIHGTPTRAFEAAEAADAITFRGRAALRGEIV